MGIELAKAVMVHHASLTGAQFKVLNRMAWSALDQPGTDGRPARLYFGGWEVLAHATGRTVDGPDVTAKSRGRVKRHVSEVLADLVDLGLLERIGGHARTGTRQTYRLTEAVSTGTPIQGTTRSPETGTLRYPETGTQEVPQNRDDRYPETGTPRTELGGTEDSRQESIPPASSLTSGAARELEAATPSSEVVRDDEYERAELRRHLRRTAAAAESVG